MSAFPKIYSKDLLKQYILRKLGGGVVNVELTQDQIDDSIDDTIEEFTMEAYSGVIERYIYTEVASGIQTYLLPYDVFAVLGVYGNEFAGMGSQGSPLTNPFHINNFIAADLYGKGAGQINLLQYELTFEMLATMNLLLGKKISFDFNCFSKNLHLFETPAANNHLFIHVYKKLTPTTGTVTFGSTTVSGETTNLYDHKWVKAMAVERARYQWAVNLMKYAGSTLPNGGQLNYEGIMNEAKENLVRLREELDNTYKLPADFQIG
jgi:hypothetical protein